MYGASDALQIALMESLVIVHVSLVGILESPSASEFCEPGLYMMLKSKDASSAIHLWLVASSFAEDKTYVSGLLSVTAVNLLPYK